MKDDDKILRKESVEMQEVHSAETVVKAIGIRMDMKLKRQGAALKALRARTANELEEELNGKLVGVVKRSLGSVTLALCSLAGVEFEDVEILCGAHHSNLVERMDTDKDTVKVPGMFSLRKGSEVVATLACEIDIDTSNCRKALELQEKLREIAAALDGTTSDKASIGEDMRELYADIVLEQVAGTTVGERALELVDQKVIQPRQARMDNRQKLLRN